MFGNLRVVQFAGSTGKRRLWLCLCSCGNTITAHSTALRTGHTKSCGCYKIEQARARATTHGMRATRLFGIWSRLRQRCGNPNNPDYARYGGRGIKVCSTWERFENFAEWALANEYDEKLTLDRIDNDGGYGPTNCRWATRAAQAINRSNTVFVEFRGERLPLALLIPQFAVVNERLVRHRVRKGWAAERALLAPLRG
jgi:hypothetical protein